MSRLLLGPFAIALCLLWVACSERQSHPRASSARTPLPEAKSAVTNPTKSLEPIACPEQDWHIDVVHRREWLGKPPLREHWADVAITNRTRADRWVVIGDRLDEAWQLAAYGVAVYELVGERSGDLWRFEGQDGFYAVRVPAQSEVLLQELPFETFWEKTPEHVVLELAAADSIEVEGQPVGQWVGHSPRPAPRKASANHREFEHTGDVMRRTLTPFVKTRQHPPEGPHGLRPERPVLLGDACTLQVEVRFTT